MQAIIPDLWALAACVVIRMAVGALWYSPLLFVKPWMKMAGITEKKMKEGMAKAIVTDLVFSLIMAFVLLHAIRYALPQGSHDLAMGLGVAFANWLGLTVPIQIGAVSYERKPFKYFLINSGYQLVTILAMGVVLTLWG